MWVAAAFRSMSADHMFNVLAAADVAEAVVSMLGCPDHVQVHDILMRPSARGT